MHWLIGPIIFQARFDTKQCTLLILDQYPNLDELNMQDLGYVFREVKYYNLPRHEILQFNQRRTDNLSDAISQKSAH